MDYDDATEVIIAGLIDRADPDPFSCRADVMEKLGPLNDEADVLIGYISTLTGAGDAKWEKTPDLSLGALDSLVRAREANRDFARAPQTA